MSRLPRRCEWCGCFVADSHLRTVRYAYDLGDLDAAQVIYGSSTATRRLDQLLCRACSRSARCMRMRESERDYETLIDRTHPHGWFKRYKAVA